MSSRTWDTLFGILPTELPFEVRAFVVLMIAAHLVAIVVWLAFFGREIGGGKRKYKPAIHGD
jgi:hypothetical protein